MSTIVAYQLPDADVWPFVLVQGFEAIATKLIQTASGRDMVLLPIVALPQLERFETFAYDYYGRVFPPTRPLAHLVKACSVLIPHSTPPTNDIVKGTGSLRTQIQTVF
jgi:hypothetical protein